MMRQNTGAEVIISWEPDYSPQMMTAITTFSETLEEQELR
jgi:hypothetical protein